MSKAMKYAKNTAIFLGLGNAVLNTIRQLNEMKDNPLQKFDWGRFFIAGSKGVIVGALSGGAIGAIEDYNNSRVKPVNTDAFLYSVVNKLKLNKEDKHYLKLQEKADLLICLLKARFSNKWASEPFRIGSTERGTALRDKFDIDIALTFKKSSFRSTAEMFDDVANFLSNKIGYYSIIKVRDQSVSIGVFVVVNQKEYKIDVVPKKRTSTSGKKKSGYLFVNDSNFWRDNSSYTKTDFHALNSVRLTEVQKKIIIILKHWKVKNNLPLSSHFLESLVLDAYGVNRNRIPGNLTEKVVMVLRHIADNLDTAFIRSVENTNNVLTNISTESKVIIIDACIDAIKKYEYQPNSIIEMFKK
jgi:hypothetical protein